MTPPEDQNADSSSPNRQDQGKLFQTTHWSVVLLAGRTGSPQSAAALETLCSSYWYPLYAFVRRQGYSAENAQDLTQEFFYRLIDERKLQVADRERGRFRSFLLASLKHFLVNEWTRDQAQKRGGGKKPISIEECAAESLFQEEAATGAAPESLYDKRWAVIVLEKAMERLQVDYIQAGREALFARLKPQLLTQTTNETCRELGEALGMTEGALKVALHRFRNRFGEAVRAEISQTVAAPEEVEDELRSLMAALSQ